MTDILKIMSNLVTVERIFIGKDFFKQLPKFGDVPLFVAKVIDETSDRITRSYFEGLERFEFSKIWLGFHFMPDFLKNRDWVENITGRG
jgi:hypothetical protein